MIGGILGIPTRSGGRVNLQKSGSDFTNADWVKTSVSVSADFEGSADKIIDTAVNNVHNITATNSLLVSLVAGKTYEVSGRFKAAGRDQVQFYLYGPSAYTSRADFLLVGAGTISGIIAGTHQMFAEDDGWYRVVMTGSAPNNGNGFLYAGLMSGGVVTYTGDGVSGMLMKDFTVNRLN